MQRSRGVLRVEMVKRGKATRLKHLYQEGCLKGRLPKSYDRGCPDVALINLAGGLTGGDDVRVDVSIGEGASAGVTTQAAEKLYRSTGARCIVDNRLSVAAGAWAEWLPQETIFFDGANLKRSLRIDAAPSARLMAVEAVIFGRAAMGETVADGRFLDRVEVRLDGHLFWHESTRVEHAMADALAHPAMGAGTIASATLLLVAEDATDWLAPLRGWLDAEGVHAGVTAMPPLLVARLLSNDPLRLRGVLVQALSRLRAGVAGLPEVMPRLWQL